MIHRDELKAVANALRKAKRVRLGFEATGDSLDGVNLVIQTEAITYKWRSLSGDFPPMLFSVDGFQIVVMPMMSDKAKEAQQEARAEAHAVEIVEAEDTTETEPTEAELQAIEAEGETTTEPTEEKPKRRRRRKRKPVAVAWSHCID